MTRLIWDKVDERYYENGVDHVVVQLDDLIIPWNGIVSIDDTEVDNAEVRSYFDGALYANLLFGGFYIGNIEALGLPFEIQEIIGVSEMAPGVSVTAQDRKAFSFSYRTLQEEDGYKIHLVYNVLASPTKSTATTLSASATFDGISLSLTSAPPSSSTYRPSSHMIVDSLIADSDGLSDLEDILYGTDITDPDFPTQAEVIALFTV